MSDEEKKIPGNHSAKKKKKFFNIKLPRSIMFSFTWTPFFLIAVVLFLFKQNRWSLFKVEICRLLMSAFITKINKLLTACDKETPSKKRQKMKLLKPPCSNYWDMRYMYYLASLLAKYPLESQKMKDEIPTQTQSQGSLSCLEKTKS